MTQRIWTTAGTLLADLFFPWVIVEYAMGGWQLGLCGNPKAASTRHVSQVAANYNPARLGGGGKS
jgi:hypothetical protein